MRSGYSEAKEHKKQDADKSTRIVDLRSDTFTQPSPEMREAIFKAEEQIEIRRNEVII